MRTGRAASHHTPDHPRGHKRPPVLVGDPVLLHYRTARRFRAEHQFPQPGLLGRDGPRPIVLFHEPKAHPDTARHRDLSQGHRK
jgi:hypothetical protein